MLIREPRADELAGLLDLELAAGELFRDVGMPEVAEYEPQPVGWLRDAAAAGLLWVAVEPGGAVPVGYLVASPIDGNLHVEQVSVHPGAARRGIGRQLIDRAAAAARETGLPALTLTTFAEVPWNAPYYARLGFTEVPPAEVTPALRRIRETEAKIGLDRWPRVVMRRPV